MKDQRERLTNLILNAPKLEFKSGSRAQGKTYQTAQNIADYLLANGCVLPPCKIGDKLYVISTDDDCPPDMRIEEETVTDIGQKHIFCSAYVLPQDDIGWEVDIAEIGKTVFLTREEAEKALKGKK